MRTASLLGATWLLGSVLASPPTFAQVCAGDCDGDGQVTVDEIVRGVSMALGNLAVSACADLDATGDGQVEIDDLVAVVANALNGCASPTSTATPMPTPTATPTAEDGVISIPEAVARDAQGIARHLGERVTTEGVVTVDAGLFANNKLKVFAQSAGAGIMVYHQSSADVDAFQAGDRVRVTGLIRQQDPTSAENPGNGTVLVDLTNGSWRLLSSANPLPAPAPVTVSELEERGTELTGTLVHVVGVQKVAGDWPLLGGRSTQVTVGDASGATLTLRFQRPTITAPLVSELQAIGDGPFDLTAIVVQDDGDMNGTLLSGFELWVRGADDIAALANP